MMEAMSLKAELKVLQTRLQSGRPPERVATMHRAVEELRASGAADYTTRPEPEDTLEALRALSRQR